MIDAGQDNKADWPSRKGKENKKKGLELPLARRLDLLVGDNWRFTVLFFGLHI